MTISVLVIDDDESMCDLAKAGLERQGYSVEARSRSSDGLALLEQRDFDAVITDLNLDGISGLDICKHITENRPDIPVIVITAFGDMRAAISAIRVGAYDFINKPIDMMALAHTVERAVQHQRLRAEVKLLREAMSRAQTGGAGKLVGNSPPMKKVYDLIARISDTDVYALITGESGTGKELVARALHTESPRRDKPFIAINCAAVPANLLESELFGHVKGAFTDAKEPRKGLFEQANGGTVLLDELGELPVEMQPKLLRVLQERTVRPVGGNVEIPFDTRIIDATNRDLETEVEQGQFREDLYYRLNVVQIHVPSLRARGNDILILAQHFIDQIRDRLGKSVEGISSEAAKKLLEYDWPGNVRQLENSMERAVALTRYDQVMVEDLPERIQAYQSDRIEPVRVDAEHMLTLAEVEHRYIEQVLKAANGNKTQAAKVLGLDRRTLYRKLERYEEP